MGPQNVDRQMIRALFGIHRPEELGRQMSGCAAPAARPDALDPEGWAHDEGGEIAEGKPQAKSYVADFRHSRELQAGDVLRTKVVEGRGAFVGFAAESYDVEKHGATVNSTARVNLSTGTTVIRSDISRDGERHAHHGHLKDYIPKTLPFDVALRISKDANVPQIQFNDDAGWHDFAPDRAAVKAGPWFPLPGAGRCCPPERPLCAPSQANKECRQNQQCPSCCTCCCCCG